MRFEIITLITLVAEDGLAVARMATGRHISLPKPFASGDVNEWCQRFEICSKANEWNDATMALKLPTLLEGEALAVWMELTADEQKDYKTAKKQMVAKMVPTGFASLEDFHRRKLQPEESVSIYVHDLKRLLDQAMPELDKNARSELVLHQFIACSDYTCMHYTHEHTGPRTVHLTLDTD